MPVRSIDKYETVLFVIFSYPWEDMRENRHLIKSFLGLSIKKT